MGSRKNWTVRRKVLVLSLDYDDCIEQLTPYGDRINKNLMGHYSWLGYLPEASDMYKKTWWDFITPLAQKNYDERIIMCGSNRQSLGSDELNRWKNFAWWCSFEKERTQPKAYWITRMNRFLKYNKEGLATDALPWLCKKLTKQTGKKWTLYPLMWYDGDRKAGISWGTNSKYTPLRYTPLSLQRFGDYMNSPNKVPLLRFQITRLVEKYGDDVDIEMYFFDDDGKDIIFKGLQERVMKPFVDVIQMRDGSTVNCRWAGLLENVTLTLRKMNALLAMPIYSEYRFGKRAGPGEYFYPFATASGSKPEL